MNHFTIYSTNYCSYCNQAKIFLAERGFPFEEVDITENHELREELSKKHNWRTVPMIFNGDEFIGGYTDLLAYNQRKNHHN